jgi:hypothetical protein
LVFALVSKKKPITVVSTTGLAGGLISPKRALLLAPLKGLFSDLDIKELGLHRVKFINSIYSQSAFDTGTPKRGHSNHRRIYLQWTH